MGPTFVVCVPDIAVPVSGTDDVAHLVSILEMAADANASFRVTGLDISFDGTVGTNKPVLVQLIRATVGGTFPSSNPGVQAENNDPSVHTSRVLSANIKFGAASAEGTLASTDGLRLYRLNPSGGVVYQLPLGRELWIPKAQFFRIRMVAANAVNATINVSIED